MALTEIPFVAGALLAWSLAAPPGPINALMAHAAARRGFLAGWVYGLGATTGDITMLALVIFGVGRVLERFPLLAVAFAFAGASLMIWFAWGAWRTARRHTVAAKLGRDEDDRPEPWPRAFAKAFAIVLTSPYNWSFWLTAGTSTIAFFGWTLGFGFFAGILAWTIFWTWLAHAGAQRVKRFSEFVSYAAALALALFALGMAWYGVTTARSLLA